MTSKQLERRMFNVWDKITLAYYDCIESKDDISEFERLQIQALMYHAKEVYRTLHELPF